MSGFFYWSLWWLFRIGGYICFRYDTVGSEHIPQQGGVLIAANHASYLDIPLLGCGIPRRVAFLGRQDLFPFPLRGILKWLGWIPIRHDRFHRTGFRRAVELIKDDQAVVIFPEGARTYTGRLMPGKPGLARIVAETGCPVLPAYIAGTFEALPRTSRRLRCHPVRVIFGVPVDFSDARQQLPKRQFYRHVSRTVMEAIADLGKVPPPDIQPAVLPSNAEEGRTL